MTLSRIAVVVGVLVALAATAVIAILLTLRTMPAGTPAVPEATTAAPEATMPAATPAARAAAADEPLKIAVVDVGKVFNESSAVKDINTQLRPFLESFRAEAAKVEQELSEAQAELARRQATVLTNDAYAEERRKLEERALGAQDEMLKRKRGLDQTKATAMRQVETTLNNIVLEIFTERKLYLILTRDQTAFFNPSLDITDEVIKRLDRQLPTVKIDIPVN